MPLRQLIITPIAIATLDFAIACRHAMPLRFAAYCRDADMPPIIADCCRHDTMILMAAYLRHCCIRSYAFR